MPFHSPYPNLTFLSLLFLTFTIIPYLPLIDSKSTIEPCSVSDSCNALLGYTLYTDLKVSQLAALFQIDTINLLTANSIDIGYPDVENHILPSQLFLHVPVVCSCVDGIRKSVSTIYKTKPGDVLGDVAERVFGKLVSGDQLKEENEGLVVGEEGELDVGVELVVPLPCTCFNKSDNGLPAVYLSYVVKEGELLGGIAGRYWTTVEDLRNVNTMGSLDISEGDILAVPLPACASKFQTWSSDFGLTVPNGSYAITAGHCVQCSCGPGNLNLYCTPSSLAVSCSNMQCPNSNLMLGNYTAQPSPAGCNVTSCTYGGTYNGTILTMLSTSLQPRCPGQHQFPPLVAPPSLGDKGSLFGPSPAPSQSQGGITPNSSVVPGTRVLPGLPPANGPTGSTSGSGTSDAPSLTTSWSTVPCVLVILFVALVAM